MTAGLDNLKRIVVLMMENRSFDHMLGALKAKDPRIAVLVLTIHRCHLAWRSSPVLMRHFDVALGTHSRRSSVSAHGEVVAIGMRPAKI